MHESLLLRFPGYFMIEQKAATQYRAPTSFSWWDPLLSILATLPHSKLEFEVSLNRESDQRGTDEGWWNPTGPPRPLSL
jgi:hypothetical protein